MAEADLSEPEHLQPGIFLKRPVELLSDRTVENRRDLLAVREQEGNVEHREFRIELHRIRADRNHVELTGADLLHVHDLVAERAAVEILDLDRIAQFLLQGVAKRGQYLLRRGTGRALHRHSQIQRVLRGNRHAP